jgi:ABC-2 type transport system permease protein
MTGLTYVRYEVLQLFRNWRFLLFSVAYPLVIFWAVGLPNKHHTFDGIGFPLYFMAGMAVVGGMIAVISTGARIGLERTSGWTRQLRITPLKPSAYFAAKVICGYLGAIITIALVCLSGVALGVRLPAEDWAKLVGLLLVGLAPLAALGVALGHLVGGDAMAPVVGGTVTALALLGGSYGFLLAKSGVLFGIMRALPSYWLVQASKVASGGAAWPALAWIVIAGWAVVMVPLAVAVYRRDASRA